VCAQTGSGKTLAYVIPLLEKIKASELKGQIHDKEGAPVCVVLAPTRELADQIFKVIKSLSHHLRIRVRLLSGGDSFQKTKGLSQSVFDVLVATPSRVRSSMFKKELSLSAVQTLIIDEADQLFDMGFKKDLAYMFESIDTSVCQFGFFTATLPFEVETFIMESFPDKKIERVVLGEAHKTQERIDTYNVRVTPSEKNMVVRMFLEKQAQGRGIVFVNQKNQADELYKYLTEKMPKAKMKLIHGDLTAKEREEAMIAFKAQKVQFLIATDIAARGIDVQDLVWVLNYGLPKTAIYYLHRAGRVARGGRHGIVYNLVASHDAKMIAVINKAIKEQVHLKLNFIPEKMNEPLIEKTKEVDAIKKMNQAPKKNFKPRNNKIKKSPRYSKKK
jgi:superfamily II DNA/RNA helicase